MARRLRPDEEALWRLVAQRTKPLHPPSQPGKRSVTSRTSAPPVTEPPIAPFSVGASAASTATRLPASQDLAEELRRSPLRMDRKTHTRMTRGRIEPQSRIDLHGMTLARAHPVLVRFILSAQAKGHRLVLVITGKGRDSRDNGPIPERRGLLRHQVPEWLWAPPLDSAVQQIAPAHRRHGGSGAYYVWLRRR